MWIEQRSANRFKFVEQYKDPLTNKYRRVAITYDRNTTHTRKQAHIVLEKRIHQRLLKLDDAAIKKNVTLEELVNNWLAVFHQQVKFNTYRNNHSRAKHILLSLGEDTLVAKITPLYLSDYLDNLIYREGYKNSSVQKFRGTLNNMFKFALKHHYLVQNPMDKVEINYRNDDASHRPEQKYLDEDELHQVLNYMYQRSPHYGRFCEFLYLTGMRYGEASSLQPTDIHPNEQGKMVASIWGTLVNGQKQPSPKTSKSRRDVVLPDQAIKLCIKEIKSHDEQTTFIFCSERGHYLGNTVLNCWLHHAKEDLHIHKILSLHTFRHTHISKLAELGVPLYLIQDRVGHKNAETTKEIYLHVTKKAEQILDAKLKYL